MNQRILPPPLLAAVAVAVVIVLLSTGCMTAPAGTEPDLPQNTLLSPTEAKALIEQHAGDPNFVLIDVCTPAEFAARHIDGAINIDSKTFEDRIDTLDKDATYLIYCLGGIRSAQVRQQMEDAGFTKVYDLEGGYNAWIADGGATGI